MTIDWDKSPMDRKRLIEILDELMTTRHRAALFLELSEAMDDEGVAKLSTFVVGKLGLAAEQQRSYTLRHEAEKMWKSGCEFNWHPRPDLCLEFLGPNGGIWNKTYEQLTNSQKGFYRSLRANFRRWEDAELALQKSKWQE